MTPETLARLWHAAQEDVLPGYASPVAARRCEWEDLSIVGRDFLVATAEIVLARMRKCGTSECEWPGIVEMEIRSGRSTPWQAAHVFLCRDHADLHLAHGVARMAS